MAQWPPDRLTGKAWRPFLAGVLLLLSAMTAADERPTLLVLGDSISAAYGLSPDKGWVALLRTRLAEHDLRWDVINASISGEKTWRGARRLPSLLTRHEPAIVVIQLGINDVMLPMPPGIEEPPLEVIRTRLTRMVQQAHAADARVLIMGVRLPARYGVEYGQRFDNVIRGVAESTGATLLPHVLARAGDRDVSGRDELLQPGASVHPNARGHMYMLERVWPVLLPLLSEVGQVSGEEGGDNRRVPLNALEASHNRQIGRTRRVRPHGRSAMNRKPSFGGMERSREG